MLDDYTGCLNLDVIEDKIVECHLRLNGDNQIYNDNFVDQLYNFLNRKTDFINYQVPKRYIIPLFVKKGYRYSYNGVYLKKMCDDYKVISLHIDNPTSDHQSEYLSRLLIFDIDNLEMGLELRKVIINSLLK